MAPRTEVDNVRRWWRWARDAYVPEHHLVIGNAGIDYRHAVRPPNGITGDNDVEWAAASMSRHGVMEDKA
jgi:hypothetical protein